METVYLAVGITLGYMVLAGIEYGVLPKNWGGAGKDDDFLRFVVSVFWPFSGPMFIGIALVAWVRRMATRSNVPRAVARDRSVR